MKLKGPILMYISTIFFAIMGLSVKEIKKIAPSSLIVFFRSLIGVIILLFIIIKNRKTFKIHKKWPLFFRGLFGALALYCYFKAISLIKLSDAAMLCYTFPIYTSILSIIFLKEKYDVWVILAVILSLIGVALIIKPGFIKLSIGHLYGFASGIFAGAAVVLVRHLKKTETSENIVFSFALFSTILTIYSPFSFNSSYSLKLVIFLLIVGIAATLAQLFSTHSYKYLSASQGSVIGLFTVFNIIILSAVLFKELPDTLSLIGGLILTCSSLFLSNHHPKDRINKKKNLLQKDLN